MSIGGNDGLFDVTKDIGLKELIEAQNDAEVQAERQAALIGDSDKVCTFEQGYINQSVYSCRTCRIGEGGDSQGERAGLCRGCAFNCHLACEVDELFTKRSFRCDCGTKRFAGRLKACCTLATTSAASASASSSSSSSGGSSSEQKREDVVNDENRYSQNFDGLYCYCSKPYVSASDTMYQCSACEDWFHDRCLVNSMPDDKDVELICKKCAPLYAFLLPYSLEYAKLKADKQAKTESANENDSRTSNNGSIEATGAKREREQPEATADHKRERDLSEATTDPKREREQPEVTTDARSAVAEADGASGPPAKRQKTAEGEDVSSSVATASAPTDSRKSDPPASASNAASEGEDAVAMEDEDTDSPGPPSCDTQATSSSLEALVDEAKVASSSSNSSSSTNASKGDTKVAISTSDETGATEDKASGDAKKCSLLKLGELEPAERELLQCELYFEMSWRDKLCRCDACVKTFDNHRLAFMLEDEDEDEEDPDAVNYINSQMEDEAQEREQREAAALTGGSVAPIPGGGSGGGASNGAFSVENMAFEALGQLPRAQVVQTISHFQVYSAAIRDGLRAWAEAHPGETVSREAMQGITQEAKRVASEARSRA